MKYISTLISVNDIERSKKFYHEVLGLDVISDLGVNVTLTGGFALQQMDTWKEFIANKKVDLHNNAVELVFEEKELDLFIEHMKKFDIEYVRDIIEHGW